jgi:hypothetical protein
LECGELSPLWEMRVGEWEGVRVRGCEGGGRRDYEHEQEEEWEEE